MDRSNSLELMLADLEDMSRPDPGTPPGSPAAASA
jgi:hypothetical protein